VSVHAEDRDLVVRDAFELATVRRPIEAHVSRSDSYAIHVVGTLRELVDRLLDEVDGAGVAIVTDETVQRLYAGPIVDGLRRVGCEPVVRALPPGERSKSLTHASMLWDWLAASGIGRRDVLVALGGGVIADTCGWVASAYMRGVPYVNLPTTLLAQVDGALGGKVAVNHESAKNLIGAFHQPKAVIADVGFLRTTDLRHRRAGLAEVIKKAVIASPALFAFVEERADALTSGDPAALEQLVRSAVQIKTRLVERDPYEVDLRRPLNFGHTIGHPLETVTGYGALLHGEAVAFGMVVESRIAAARGLLDEPLLERLVTLLRRCGLPTTADELGVAVDGTAILDATEKVRLIRAGSLRYVLPMALGETLIADDVTREEVVGALHACGVAACPTDR
jgi:3-dehydroquinate synthase